MKQKYLGEETETNKMQLIWFLLSNFYSTCFGHHYAHLQEKKTVYNCIWCSALVVMAVVVWSWAASCVHSAHNQISFILLVPLSSPYVRDARSQGPKI